MRSIRNLVKDLRPTYASDLFRRSGPVMEQLEDRRMLSLLGLTPGFPIITYDSTGVTTYNATTTEFDTTATPLRFRETGASPLRLITGSPTFEVHFRVDNAGNLIGGVAGDDIKITGTIDINGVPPPDATGVLLTGEISEFGYAEAGTSDQFDARFTPTGGSLFSYWSGQDIYLLLTVENSTFNNSFASDFGGHAKGSVGTVAPLLSSISGYVYWDTNDDGNRAGEPPIPGTTVTLTGTNVDGVLINTNTTTNASGYYEFTGLRPGNYTITETQPGGYQDGQDTIGTPGGSTANDVFSNINLPAGFNGVENNFGELKPASIGDFVWHDLNANGQQDGGEPGIDGVGVRLYDSGNVLVGSTTTSGGGFYLFSNLHYGDYHVEFDVVPGYVRSPQDVGSDGSDSDANAGGVAISTHLDQGETDLTWDAGYYQTAAIGDFVWHDLNANGQQDGGEPAIAGVGVRLYDSGNNLVGVTATNLSGLYLFSGLTPGNYHVEFDAVAGFVRSPQDAGADSSDSDANASGVAAVTTLTSGETDLTWDAGYYQTAAIGDFVWHDLNANGQQDLLEPGISGVGVRLYDSGNNLVGTTATNLLGFYLFSGLTPGNYHVEFDAVGGFVRSPQDVGSDVTDSDANATGVAAVTTLTSGETDLTWDAGYYQGAAIGDYVWHDLNANGQQDSGEPGISGVGVRLYDSGNNLVGTTSTNGSGLYLFSGLTPGNYHVEFDAVAGFVRSPGNVGSDTTDSDANATGVAAVTTLTSGETDLTWDAGYYQTAAIGDYTWKDLNNNGQQDSGEPAISGVGVRLYNASNTLVGSTTTNGSGFYLFSGLTPGDYHVEFDAVAGLNRTTANVGSDATDSDANASTGVAAVTTLTSGETDLTWDAGYFEVVAPPPKVSISGTKFLDITGNGMSGDDTPLTGVTVTIKLYADTNNNGTLEGTDTLVSTISTSAANGTYSFTNLNPGKYLVQEVSPAGYVRTGPTNKDYIAVTATTGGQTYGGNNFYNAEMCDDDQITCITYKVIGSSGSTTVTDLRGNTNQGNTVQVTFTITAGAAPHRYSLVSYTAPDAFFDANTASQQEVFDIDTGVFGPGTYTMEVSIPDCNYQIDFVCGAVIDHLGPAGSNIFYTPQGRLISADNDGYNDCPPETNSACLSGYVYVDADNDGVKETGEGGIAGVTVTLTTTDEHGAAVTKTAVTNSYGKYTFTGLREGVYKVVESQPAGYVDGKDTAGSSGGIVTNDQIRAIVLGVGENATNYNFGEKGICVTNSSLAGRVYIDRDNDGCVDTGEGGICNVKITLTGTDCYGNSVNRVTYTDSYGKYKFDDLAAGTYAIQELDPSGYADGRETVGSTGGTASNDYFYGITLAANEDATGYNFGERPY